MKTIKLFTFKLMLLFLTTSVLVNCESDAIVEAQEEVLTQAKQAPYSSRLVYTNEIESNQIISERLRALPQTRNAASFENEMDSFTVETNTAMYIEKTDGSGYSYTFVVDRDGIETTTVENLVLSVNNETQEVSSTLIAYKYSAAQLQELLTMGHVSTDAEIIATSINADFSNLLTENNSLPCTVHTTTYHIIPYDEDETRHYYGDNSQCNHINHETGVTECEVVTVTNIWCPPTSSGTQSSGSTTTNTNTGNQTTDDPSNNTSNGGTVTQPNSNNDIVSSPVTKEQVQEITQQLNNLLGDDWELIEPTENVISFETVEELEEFMNEFEDNFTMEETEIVSDPDGTVIIKFKGKFSSAYLLPLYLNIHVKTTLDNVATINDNEHNIISLTSYLSGISSFVTWNQQSTLSIDNGNTTTVTINGVMTFQAKVKYINEIKYEEDWTITVTYNNQTGEAISMSANRN